MKHLFSVLILAFLCSCSNKKLILLPELEHSDITEILDVSAAYLFYDESKPDSIQLNRNNLISTTNWLVNVDKRLKLYQAIPSIIFIQNKKRNAKLHKNENAKNYYTCNDKEINNLGFIEFTNIYYHQEELEDYLKSQNISNFKVLNFSKEGIRLNKRSILLKELNALDFAKTKVFLKFDKHLSFQQYISYKEQLIELDPTKLNIDNDEFIY